MVLLALPAVLRLILVRWIAYDYEIRIISVSCKNDGMEVMSGSLSLSLVDRINVHIAAAL